MNAPDIYLLPEAAFVLREPVEEVRRTIDRKQVDTHMVTDGGRKVRALDHKTLVFLSWAREHQEDLRPTLWRKLYESLRQHPELPTHIDTGVFRASLDKAAKEVDSRLKTLRELETGIARNAVGDVVLKGTDIEVHRIASLLSGGMSTDEILNDYPSLRADQIAFACTYAATYPKAGRPFPKLTAKAAMAQADFSELDLDG
ncbi:MAG: DUF433 domain-containing protein [Microvirga sp.]